MIEDKEAYRNKRTELSNKRDELVESLSYVDAVRELLKTYKVRHLSELKPKIEAELDAVEDEYDEFTKEETETFAKMSKEFTARQIEWWIAQGYDMVDLVDGYLRGYLDQFKPKDIDHE